MSHLYVFCATAGAVAYGVCVAVGMWAQKSKLKAQLDNQETVLAKQTVRIRELNDECVSLDAELTGTKGSLNAVTISYDETRHKLIETQDELSRALSRLCCTLYDVADIRGEKIEELKKLEEEIGTKCTTDVVEKLEAAMKERSE